MTSRDLRQSFLDFFAHRKHKVLASSSLKSSDETTLFTSAGMHPFVPWFRGLVPPAAPRVTTCQKCFRADDIEEVGATPIHLTFFEMLGNFSFGDYFKQGAIEYAWEYVTQVLQIPAERIWVTVYPEDDESPGIWRSVSGLPAGRIVEDATNWWGPVGDSGPCGPDTELHYDRGEESGCGRSDCNPTCSCPRFCEIWNVVFQTYNKMPDGALEPLPKPGVDTGMGLERTAMVMQNVSSVFETDLFAPIIAAVSDGARAVNPKLGDTLTGEQETAVKVVAEHTRALAFLLADGFTPSNDGPGYVLRRVLRRASRLARKLGVEDPFLHTLVAPVVSTMGDAYPELVGTRDRIAVWVEQEEKQFRDTLDRGWGPLTDTIARAKASQLKVLPGEEVFRLHDTYGLPKDLVADVAAESGIAIDEQGFEQSMDRQRQRARAGAAQDFAFSARAGYHGFVGKTRFLGYQSCVADGVIIGLMHEGAAADRLSAGQEGEVFLDQTAFYAESGGQVGDRGEISAPGAGARVLDTTHPVEGAHSHHVRVTEGELTAGQQVSLKVDDARRRAIARAHTATHLLHHALRSVLGEHAVQSGSLVDADRLRFDFAHFAALTPDERRRIEDMVVALSLNDDEIATEEMALTQAQAAGATALFGEKYGERVRVVAIGGYSKELCGGTHLSHGSAIGGFSILTESSIGAGLRRIEAVSGEEAQALAVRHRETLSTAAGSMRCRPEEVADRVEALQSQLRAREKEIVRLQERSAGARTDDLLASAIEVNGARVLAARVEGVGAEALRTLADRLLKKLGSGVVVLACEVQGRAQFVGEVSPDLVSAGYHAGKLIGEVAKVAGGGGGGRPDFAQAGGKDPGRIDEALGKVKQLVADQKG